jgi:N-acyl-D-amino-acid deacylase
MHDLVIRGGRVVDGTGSPPTSADVTVSNGRITGVGRVEGPSRRVMDVDGAIVTPGFVDIHTHYDGQAFWDPDLTPSCWHGVTTTVLGNCSVGFAPCAPRHRELLMEMMESVEDIPAACLNSALNWEWETFPEYLTALDRTERSVDIGIQIPHSVVRTYVMGERGILDEPATPDEIQRMKKVVKEAIVSGALGVSASRTVTHRTRQGRPIAGTFATREELLGIGDALGEAGGGVFEVAPAGVVGEDLDGIRRDMEWLRILAKRIDQPVCFLLNQTAERPDDWRDTLHEAQRAGLVVQVAGRPSGLLFGLRTTFHPLDDRPSFAAVRTCPPSEVRERLRDPTVRAAILAESQSYAEPLRAYVRNRWDRMYPFSDPVDYEPGPERSLAAMAEAKGTGTVEHLLDLTAEDPHRLFMLHINNYAQGDAEPLLEMLLHPSTVLGLGDGGAHVAIICDASQPTTVLTHWARDRRRGRRVPLETTVRWQTKDTASLYGLGDRGVIAPGYLADLNVIDFDRLAVKSPRVVDDLPGGATRLIQRAEGYIATVKTGGVTLENDELTGDRPGRVIRGAQRPTP